jgi:hypothetical protein
VNEVGLDEIARDLLRKVMPRHKMYTCLNIGSHSALQCSATEVAKATSGMVIHDQS